MKRTYYTIFFVTLVIGQDQGSYMGEKYFLIYGKFLILDNYFYQHFLVEITTPEFRCIINIQFYKIPINIH